MATRGFELVYLETHNWGKSAAFWQALGFKLDFEQTDHGHSGTFVADNGTRVFLEEKDLQDPVSLDLYLGAPSRTHANRAHRSTSSGRSRLPIGAPRS